MTAPTTEKSARQQWLRILANAPRDALRACVSTGAMAGGSDDSAAAAAAGFEWLRAPETGLTMVRARVGNTGDRFNLGETTLTRSVARHRAADGRVAVGVGYVRGRDPERSRWVAMLDALLQQPAHHATIMHEVIDPLRAAIDRRHADERSRTAASRVRFFTMQSESA